MLSCLHACDSGSGLELKDIRPLATVGVKSITSFAITLVAEPATAHSLVLCTDRSGLQGNLVLEIDSLLVSITAAIALAKPRRLALASSRTTTPLRNKSILHC